MIQTKSHVDAISSELLTRNNKQIKKTKTPSFCLYYAATLNYVAQIFSFHLISRTPLKYFAHILSKVGFNSFPYEISGSHCAENIDVVFLDCNALKMETICFSEMLVSTYNSSPFVKGIFLLRYIPGITMRNEIDTNITHIFKQTIFPLKPKIV
jgi:hypothetical protein